MSYLVFVIVVYMYKLPWLWERELILLLYRLLITMLFLFREVSSSSWCLEYAALFYCGTHWAFQIITLSKQTD